MDERQGRIDTFVRGLLSGAVVGAAIAGSAIWERRRRAAQAVANMAVGSPEPGAGGAPAPDAASRSSGAGAGAADAATGQPAVEPVTPGASGGYEV